jgi:uncharacterized damage-inducible protein DinB
MSSRSNRSELEAIRDWFDYNTFVRKRYLAFFAKLPESVLTKDRGASFPSILDITTHILNAYKAWLRVYETGRWGLPEPKNSSLEKVKALEDKVDSYITDFMSSKTSNDLNSTFQFTRGSAKGRKEHVIKRRLADMLWHLVEEELQHRGEINALLWQDDISPPVTSWGKWMREKAKVANGSRPSRKS